MRITFISPANMSGGVRVVAIYAKALMQMGHAVCIVSPPPPAMPPLRKLKSWLTGNGWPADPAPLHSHFDDGGIDRRVPDRWRPVADADVPDADVVVATWWETAEWVAALRARKGVKVYFIQHHEIHDHLPAARVEATYRLPLHKIVVASWLKRVMHEHYGDDIVDVVPNSVDRTQFFAAIRGKQPVATVGFLYSTAHFKGLDAIFAALRIVRARFPDLRMISFGSQAPSPELALPDGSEFVRQPAQDKIRELYARCDVWIAASRSEGFNLPALEAMACRTPVVSTRAGWPEEAIRSEWNGVLVDVDDVPALAHSVEWVLSRSDAEWRALSANAYATAAAGSWQDSARMFEAALKHACQRAVRGEIEGAGAPIHPS